MVRSCSLRRCWRKSLTSEYVVYLVVLPLAHTRLVSGAKRPGLQTGPFCSGGVCDWRGEGHGWAVLAGMPSAAL